MTQFKCKDGCHECCTFPPLKKSFLLKYEHLVKGRGLVVYDAVLFGYCFVKTDDLMCPFLQDDKCVVYNDRPKLCRKFGEHHDYPCIYVFQNGIERPIEEQKRIKNMWEEKKMRIKLLATN